MQRCLTRPDLGGGLRVLDESLKRLSDSELLPKGLTSAVGKTFVPSRTDATVSAPQPTGGISSGPPRRSVRTLNATGFYKPTGKIKYLERRESRGRLFEFTPSDFEEAAAMEEQTAPDSALDDIEKSEAPKLQALVAGLKKQEARVAKSEEDRQADNDAYSLRMQAMGAESNALKRSSTSYAREAEKRKKVVPVTHGLAEWDSNSEVDALSGKKPSASSLNTERMIVKASSRSEKEWAPTRKARAGSALSSIRRAQASAAHWRLFEGRWALLRFRLCSCLKIMFLFRNFRDSAENSDIYRGFRGFRY